MNAAINHIIVRPERITAHLDLVGGKKWTAPVKGTVLSVPARGVHYIDELEDIRGRYGQDVPLPLLHVFRHFMQHTLPTDTGIEVWPGDTVYFSWLSNHRCMVGEDLVMPYGALVSKGVYPLNGHVLVKMDEVEQAGDVNSYSSGTVFSVGKMCRFAEGGEGRQFIQEGMRVHFNRGSVVRLEVDEFKQLNPEGTSSLFRIKRKDILAYEV